MSFGIKRIVKPNIAEKASFKNLPELSGSVFFFSRVGSGKSVSELSFIQKYHDNKDKNYKIFDLYGGDRNEHLYWCFPSQDKKYWNNVKKLLSLNEDGPKQYKVHLLYPYYKSTTPKMLPFDSPNIKSSVFTIPIKDIVAEDIYLATGLMSESDKYLWRESMEKLKNKDGPRMLNEISEKFATKNQALYRNFILPLCKNLLLQSSTASTNINIIEEMKDRETISILCMEFIPKELKLFIMGFIMRQISNALDNGKIRPKNILLIREAAEFFRATDDSILPETYKMFRIQLSHFLRMGRRGMHFFLDSQSPHETHGILDGSQDITILGRLPSEADREDATAQLYRDNLITKRQVQQLATLEPGQMMFVEVSKKAKLRYIFLPRTMYWKPGYGNFYENIYKKLNNNWKNFEEITSELENKWNEEETHLKELKLLEEMKKQKMLEEKLLKEENEKLLKEENEFKRKERLKDIKKKNKRGFDEQKGFDENDDNNEINDDFDTLKPSINVADDEKDKKGNINKPENTSIFDDVLGLDD